MLFSCFQSSTDQPFWRTLLTHLCPCFSVGGAVALRGRDYFPDPHYIEEDERDVEFEALLASQTRWDRSSGFLSGNPFGNLVEQQGEEDLLLLDEDQAQQANLVPDEEIDDFARKVERKVQDGNESELY
ncbi:uncharacterized protein VTP21DRAFT_10043 [Calcarisporiella thermophila]|uniref:uncharacterized protein n=1 Tax=Calcarisporiella thermophila TaxID=911321 RepID=UPI0037446CA1